MTEAGDSVKRIVFPVIKAVSPMVITTCIAFTILPKNCHRGTHIPSQILHYLVESVK